MHPGLHFLLARVFLSRPDAGPNAPERAKEELKKELQIDPNNAGAHYILGELARRANNCDRSDAGIPASRETRSHTSLRLFLVGVSVWWN